MNQSYPIRAIGADEFAALADVDAQAFLEPWTAEALQHEQITAEFDRTFAAFDGDQMVGTGANYSFQLTVPGDIVPAAGVTRIAVLPSHRRRGILTAMMARLFADAAGQGGAGGHTVRVRVSHLRPLRLRPGLDGIRPHDPPGRRPPGDRQHQRPAKPAPVRLRAAEPLAAKAELAAVFDAERARRPGMLARDERWWTSRLTDVPALRPAGTSPLRCLLAEDDNGPRGYALYRTKPNWDSAHLAEGLLQVREMHATRSGRDRRAVVRSAVPGPGRRGIRLDAAAGRAAARPARRPAAGPADSRRRTLAAAHRPAGRDAATPLCGGRRPGARGQRPAHRRQRRALAAADPRTGGRRPPAASGPGRRRTSGSPSRRSRAGYLGGAHLSQLAGAGHVAELTPGALAALGTALSWDRPPFSGMLF